MRIIPVSVFLLTIWVAAPLRADEMIKMIIKESVDVRSGPSDKYYVTNKLLRGDSVNIIDRKGDYLAITPPPIAFSYVSKQAVRKQAMGIGVVDLETPALIGSEFGPDRSASSKTLPRGSIVMIRDEVSLRSESGPPEEFYRISPVSGEVRYIPVDAIANADAIATKPKEPPAMTPPLDSPPPADVADLRYRASQAYARGENTGNWTEAEELYKQMARSPHQPSRNEALNRLEYIWQRRNGGVASGNQPTNTTSGNPNYRTVSQPRVSSVYAYGTDNGPVRLQPIPQTNPPAKPPAVPAGNNQANYVPPTNPPSTPAAIPPANPPAKAPIPSVRTEVGYLRYYGNDGGQPLYYLSDHSTQLKFLVAAGPNVDLKRFRDSYVKIQGTEGYHKTERKAQLTATMVETVSDR